MNYLEFESTYTNCRYEDIRNHLHFYFYSAIFRQAKESSGGLEIHNLRNGIYFDTYHFRKDLVGKNHIRFERFNADKEFLFEPTRHGFNLSLHGVAIFTFEEIPIDNS